jgi:hypothetical protein
VASSILFTRVWRVGHILCSPAEGTREVDVEPGLLLGLLEINLKRNTGKSEV